MALFEDRTATRDEVLQALAEGHYERHGDRAASQLYQDLYAARIAALGATVGSDDAIAVGASTSAFLEQYGLLEINGWTGQAFNYELGVKFVAPGADAAVGGDDDAGGDGGAGAGDPKLTPATEDERFGLRGPSSRVYGWEGGQPGQYQQFLGILPDTPGYGGLSGFGQRAFQDQFGPMAAGYALQNIASPFAVEWGSEGKNILPEGFTPSMSGVVDPETDETTMGQSFYDYARNPQTGFGSGLPNIFTGFDPSLTVPTSGPTQQQYTNIFGQLAPFFAPQDVGATQNDLFAGATPSQKLVLDWIKNRDIAENLITQYALQGVDPMFRNIYEQNQLQPAFSQFYTDPALLTQPGGLMGRFLNQGLGGVGNKWLGGSERWKTIGG